MPVFGTISLWTALVAVVGSIALYLAANAKRGNPPVAAKLTCGGRGLFVVAACSVLAAAATLGALLVTHRFDVQYVYEHSARAMAPLYWFPSFWAGQEGSFLLWAFWTAILGVVLAVTSGNAERRVMPIYGVVLLFLAVLLVIRSPFVPTLDQFGLRDTPSEGLGLNPNLENPWMVIHPPTMFLGFASLAIPFAFALSALFWKAKDEESNDGWLRRALPWGLFGFAILGLAMMMGGYWAYEMLGWGGFWAWDPVENGPFIPWMGLIGFLHAAQIQRVRGGFMRPTLFFATLPLLGGLYESFMTRSGALSDFSVHSFSKLGGVSNALLLGALLLVVAFSLWTLFRRPGSGAPPADGGRPSVWEAPNSREYGFTLALVLLTLCAVIAAVGMSAPALTGLGVKLGLAKYSASVSEDYHNRAMFPLAVLLAIGLGIGPHLAWRGRGAPDARRLVTAYAVSVLAALGFIVLTRFVGTGLTGAKLIPQLLLFTAAIFALVSNAFMLRQLLPAPGAPKTAGSGGRVWTVGGALSHLGVAVLLLGVVCLVTFVHKDPSVLLWQGQTKSVLDGQYRMTYRGQTGDWQTDRDNALRFDVVSRDGREKFTAHMPFALRAIEGGDKKIIGHPAIVHHAGGDLYLALKDGPDYNYPRGRYVQKIKLGDTKTFGPYQIQFVKFERDPRAAAFVQQFQQMPDVFPMWAVLRVTYQGKTTLLRPQYVMRRDNPNLPQTPELKLPGSYLLSFNDTPDAINAGSADPNSPNAGAASEGSQFVLRPDGPVLEGFQLEVTTRPMINLVWVGTLLLVFGGLLSMGRRIRENRALPVPDMPEPEPQASPKLPGRRRARGRAPSGKPAPSLARSSRRG